MILYVNACARDVSRTKRLADYLIGKLKEPVSEVWLPDIAFPVADEKFLSTRDALIAQRKFDHPLFDLARQFAAADTVVVAAPYWDMSFPAALKQYFEQINVVGVTFFYSPEGIPVSLCRAKRLYYVTTAGGPIISEEFGYGYVKALAQGFYGIPEAEIIKAEGLDIDGADVSGILSRAQSAIDRLAKG